MNKELINLLINSELNFNSANEIRVYLNQIDSLLMDFNALTNQWKKAISSEQRELTVFTQDEIEYKFRPTIEENIIVFQIFPEPFGSASGELHKLLLETIKKLYPQNSPNPNYICWIESKYNKQNLNFAQIKELIYNGNNDAWAYQIINEGIKILKDICASLPDKLQASNEVKRLFDKTNK